MFSLLQRGTPLLLLAVVLTAVYAAAPPRADVSITLVGKVVPLADLVAKTGSRLDADAAPYWLALVTDDGKVYPLVKDGGSRLFFLDPALLDRKMRVQARRIPGSDLLRVMAVNSVIDGREFEMYYWCNVCSIRRGEKMICECCGAKMDFVEEPMKK